MERILTNLLTSLNTHPQGVVVFDRLIVPKEVRVSVNPDWFRQESVDGGIGYRGQKLHEQTVIDSPTLLREIAVCFKAEGGYDVALEVICFVGGVG